MPASSSTFAFVLLANPQLGQSLRTSADNHVAESIGDAIKIIDRQYASHIEHGGPGETSTFGQTIAAQLQSQEQVLVNPEVSRVVAEGNALAAMKVVDDNDTCNRNWKAPCPTGWLQVGNSHCSAPASYTGGCPRMQSFEGHSLAARLKFADDCDAQWPCATACVSGTDFDNCPTGWADVGDGYCSSPGATKCLPSYKFSAMSIAQKEEFSFVCGFEWPCHSACTEDYQASCPEGWMSVGDECMGPSTYAGECDFSFTTKGMSAAQKQALAESCGVRFPCSK